MSVVKDLCARLRLVGHDARFGAPLGPYKLADVSEKDRSTVIVNLTEECRMMAVCNRQKAYASGSSCPSFPMHGSCYKGRPQSQHETLVRRKNRAALASRVSKLHISSTHAISQIVI